MSLLGTAVSLANNGAGGLQRVVLPTFANPVGGRVMILICVSSSSTGLTPTIPAGYTQLGATLSANSTASVALMKKYGDVSDSGATVDFGFAASRAGAVARVYDAVGDVDQLVTQSAGFINPLSLPAVPNLQARGERVVAFYGGRGSFPTVFTPPAGWAHEVDAAYQPASGGAVGSSDVTVPGQSLASTHIGNGFAAGVFMVSMPQQAAFKKLRVAGAWATKPVWVRAASAWH